MTAYDEEDFLPISALQHYAFCPRQWGLIHIEQAWKENLLTVQGAILHEKAHGGGGEKRGGVVTARSMPVCSRTLGIRGVCDVVEFYRDENGVALHGRDGAYSAVPVEYKRGKPKEHDADALQLCAQALCLEEMLVCDIPFGFLFYNEVKRRQRVELDDALRQRVLTLLEEMHGHFQRGYTPRAKPAKRCASCSLNDLCLPKLLKHPSAAAYIRGTLQEADA